MQLNRALVRRAHDDGSAVLVGVITLVGCTALIVAAILPWLENTAFGISFTTLGVQDGAIFPGLVAMISAAMAVRVLLRRTVVPGVAIVLVLLAGAELGLAIWVAANILDAIEQVDSRQVLIGAIGTGAYTGVAGAVITLAGGILAWTRRARPDAADGDSVGARGDQRPSR